MFLTEREILDTANALTNSTAYFDGMKEQVSAFFENNTQRKFVVLGCGSSHMLAKGTATLFQSLPNTSACAIPAGDYIVDPDCWRESVQDSIVISLSRSGRTSEMVMALRHIKEQYKCPVISVCMSGDNDIVPMSDLDLIMDWCYDESVCQTRTVTNLYAMSLFLAAAYAKDNNLEQSVRAAAESNGAFQTANRGTLEKIAELDWNNAVVLADGPVCGIAEEGALAFTEIAMLTGRYFHLLDYRHGPIVISSEETLTLILLRPGEEVFQGAMVRDVIARGGPVITLSDQPGNPYQAQAHIQIEEIENFAAWGIPFIYVAQMLALLKSINLGGNPDAPAGLDPYIKL